MHFHNLPLEQAFDCVLDSWCGRFRQAIRAPATFPPFGAVPSLAASQMPSPNLALRAVHGVDAQLEQPLLRARGLWASRKYL